MQLVLLAAGHGRRFGGLKQLAPVGPRDEAIMDNTARSAAASGFESVVLVVREEIRAEISAHVRRRWPAELAVELVCQAPVPGTAQAVLSARPLVTGPFAVANADDLYGDEAFVALVSKVDLNAAPRRRSARRRSPRPATTPSSPTGSGGRSSPAPVTRGLCEVGELG